MHNQVGIENVLWLKERENFFDFSPDVHMTSNLPSYAYTKYKIYNYR